MKSLAAHQCAAAHSLRFTALDPEAPVAYLYNGIYGKILEMLDHCLKHHLFYIMLQLNISHQILFVKKLSAISIWSWTTWSSLMPSASQAKHVVDLFLGRD